MAACVIDASIAAAWILPDERNEAADALMAGLAATPGRVPSLFWFETRSLFLNAERRGRLKPGEAVLSMAQLRGLPLQDDGAGEYFAVRVDRVIAPGPEVLGSF